MRGRSLFFTAAFFAVLGSLMIGGLNLLAFTLPNDSDGHAHFAGVVADQETCGQYVRGAENSGYQTNPATYDYSMPSPIGAVAAAGQPDHHWVHDTNGDFIVWEMSSPASIVDVFPSIDHGPVPEEAIEVTVWGTNDLGAGEGTWDVADVTMVFDQGRDANWISDDYVSRWQFGSPYTYIGVHWGGPKAMIADGDAEIDAVCVPTSLSSCGPYADQDALVDDSRPNCRATYIYDAGQGNLVDRQDLLNNAGYFTSQGFDINFLWYAQEQSVTFQSGDPTDWSYCPTITEHTLQTCSLGPAFVNVRSIFSQDVKLNLWKFGNTFISRACGNFSQTQADVPVPVISGHKFEDVNGNGTWDGNEPPVEGWQITLTNPDGGTQVVQTNSQGEYSFDIHTRPGKYTITEESRPKWGPTNSATRSITIPEGAGSTEFGDNDFGNQQTPTSTLTATATATSTATSTVTPTATSTESAIATATKTATPTAVASVTITPASVGGVSLDSASAGAKDSKASLLAAGIGVAFALGGVTVYSKRRRA